ncbi:hypothetical protein ACPWSR_17625 [Alloiococcus sp. CFN-8]|uniref:hypothetical protein n=1 Tax=Alloiococcus sp. CFN-8 TaxID=3416081 RepID=UPI003CF1C770
MDTFIWILFIIALSLGTFIAYNFLNKYVLYKLKINRWAILSIAMVVLIAPAFLSLNTPIWMGIQSAIFVVLFLWFVDLTKLKKEEAKKIKIRPKAKPNRVKYSSKDKK